MLDRMLDLVCDQHALDVESSRWRFAVRRSLSPFHRVAPDGDAARAEVHGAAVFIVEADDLLLHERALRLPPHALRGQAERSGDACAIRSTVPHEVSIDGRGEALGIEPLDGDR